MGVLPTTTIAVVASLLALTAAGHFTLRRWALRWADSEEAKEAAVPRLQHSTRWWLTQALKEMLPALALLVWIHGVYFALIVGLHKVLALGPESKLLWALKLGYGIS